MKTKTVTREQQTKVKRRPNKTITTSRHRTISRNYGRAGSKVMNLIAGVSLGLYRAYRMLRTPRAKSKTAK